MTVKHYILLSLAVSAMFIIGGCSKDDDSSPTHPTANASDCFGCHTDQAMLIATMAPDTTPEPENPGEG